MKTMIRDVMGLSGLGLVLYGLSLWSVPLAWIAAGVSLGAGSLLWALLGKGPK